MPIPNTVAHPKLVATGDQNGAAILSGEMDFLSEWNRRLSKLATPTGQKT
jgi:hypothetical protein